MTMNKERFEEILNTNIPEQESEKELFLKNVLHEVITFFLQNHTSVYNMDSMLLSNMCWVKPLETNEQFGLGIYAFNSIKKWYSEEMKKNSS